MQACKITKNCVSSVDQRKFWYVTSKKEMADAAAADPEIGKQDVVFVDRENTLDSTSGVRGTQSFYHVRGESKAAQEGVYNLHTSEIPCACDVCLDGKFNECEYLRERGNVKSFSLRKKKDSTGH